MRLTLADLLAATRGELLARGGRRLCRRLSTDTRTLRRGDWFVALRGPNFDAHTLLGEAVARGAAGLIVARLPEGFACPPRLPVIRVDDTLRALGDIAAHWRRRLPELRVIAVTGSTGKTTTKDLLGRIMARHAPTLVTAGNLNNLVGLPLMVQRLTARHRWAVLEIGMSWPGEIDRLAEIIAPDIGLITNVGEAHVGNFRDGCRGVFAAKAELIPRIAEGGTIVLNAEDKRHTAALVRRARRRGLHIVRFCAGRDPRADLWTEAVVPLRSGGHRVTLATWRERAEFALPAVGLYNVANLAGAAAAALAAGVPLAAMPAALRGFRPTGLRSSLRVWRGARIVVDCYNANPQSMAQALASLRAMPTEGRRIAVLGDMFELGRWSKGLHRALGRVVHECGIDHLVTFGEQARLIAERARGVPARHFRDPESCAAHLRRVVQPRDLVLIKGSRGMAMERILEALGVDR